MIKSLLYSSRISIQKKLFPYLVCILAKSGGDYVWLIQTLFQSSFVKSSPVEVLLGKGILKQCSKFTGKHPFRSAIRAWVFSCKIAASFQNTFIQEHLCFCFVNPVAKLTPSEFMESMEYSFKLKTNQKISECYIF